MEEKKLKHNYNFALMHEAVLSNNLDWLNTLIEFGYDVDIKDYCGNTALHKAIQFERSSEVIKFLVHHGANINEQNLSLRTPFHYAVKTDVKIVRFLIENGAEIELVDLKGRTPLIQAAMVPNNNKIAKLLIQLSANIHAKDKECESPLHKACSSSNFATAKLLIDLGVDPNLESKNRRRPLHFAAEILNNMRVIKLLIDNSADLNAKDGNGKTPFMNACRAQSKDSFKDQKNAEGNIKIVKFLYQMGSDVKAKDAEGFGSLHHACCVQENNTEIIEFLLKNGVDINDRSKDERTPLYEAAFWGNTENVKFLLEKDADVKILTPDLIEKLYVQNKEKPKIKEAIRVIQKHLRKLKKMSLVDDEIIQVWKFVISSMSDSGILKGSLNRKGIC